MALHALNTLVQTLFFSHFCVIIEEGKSRVALVGNDGIFPVHQEKCFGSLELTTPICVDYREQSLDLPGQFRTRQAPCTYQARSSQFYSMRFSPSIRSWPYRPRAMLVTVLKVKCIKQYLTTLRLHMPGM